MYVYGKRVEQFWVVVCDIADDKRGLGKFCIGRCGRCRRRRSIRCSKYENEEKKSL